MALTFMQSVKDESIKGKSIAEIANEGKSLRYPSNKELRIFR